MYNWAEVNSELIELENRVSEKLDRIISLNSNAFPFNRLKKGKQIISLCRATRLLIEKEHEKDAEILFYILVEMGIKLKNFR